MIFEWETGGRARRKVGNLAGKFPLLEQVVVDGDLSCEGLSGCRAVAGLQSYPGDRTSRVCRWTGRVGKYLG